jgi:HPt (histidine-containing phosphotransfer) domain-containing protein
MSNDIWNQARLEADLLDNVTLMYRVIHSFLTDLPKALAAIAQAVDDNNASALAKAAHYLHGSAAQLQLAALAHHCKSVQQHALQNITDHQQVSQLQRCADSTQAMLQNYLTNHSPNLP